MVNPLSALPMFDPSVPQGTFSRSFVKGAGSGALMMGIFSGVMTAAWGIGLVSNPLGWAYAATMIGIGAVSTGLFSGVTATQRAAETAHAANTVSHAASRAPVRAPEQSVSHAPEHAQHNQRAWTERVGQDRASGQNRVSQIIADRSLSDGDRAAAILREREQSSTLNASR